MFNSYLDTNISFQLSDSKSLGSRGPTDTNPLENVFLFTLNFKGFDNQ